MEEAFPCLEIVLLKNPVPSLPNHFPFHGEAFVENSTKSICYVPRQAPSKLQSWIDQKLIHSLCLDPSLLRSSDMSKGGNAVMPTGFISSLTVSVWFPLSEGEERNTLSWIFPMLLERRSSFSSVLNLNQALTQEAPTACQFSEFEQPFVPVTFSRHLWAEKRIGPSCESRKN